MNAIGYDSLRSGRAEDAIRLFAQNAKEYPESSNVYDSLGDGYAAAGQKAAAIENYEKALKLDPQNTESAAKLKKLKEEK